MRADAANARTMATAVVRGSMPGMVPPGGSELQGAPTSAGIITAIGEAGIGRSRPILEDPDSLNASGKRFYEGSCVRYGVRAVLQSATIGQASACSIQRGSAPWNSARSYGSNASWMSRYVIAWCIAASGSASSA